MQLLNNFNIIVFNRDEIEYTNSKAHVAHQRAKEQHKLFVPPRAKSAHALALRMRNVSRRGVGASSPCDRDWFSMQGHMPASIRT